MHRAHTLSLLAFWALGCGDSATDQPCRPHRQDCPKTAEACTVDLEGFTQCITDPGEVGQEGDLCGVPEDCSKGLGCIRVFGLPRCLRFCAPADEGDLTEPCASDPGTHPYSAHARCIAVIRSGAEVGACVLPCQPATGGDSGCPANEETPVGCGLPPGSDFAVCGAAGEALPGQPCGTTASCAPGGLCTRRAEGFVCREAASTERSCEAQTLFELVDGAADPLDTNADPYGVCSPCKLLGNFGGRWVEVCLGLGSALNAQLICAGEDGEVSDLVDADVDALATAAKALFDEQVGYEAVVQLPGGGETVIKGEVYLWTSLTRSVTTWSWPDGTVVANDDARWGEPLSRGSCALLDLEGRLRRASCDTRARALCSLR